MDNTDDLLTIAHYQAWPLSGVPNVEVFVGHAWMASDECFQYATGITSPRYPVPMLRRHAISADAWRDMYEYSLHHDDGYKVS